MSQLHARLHDAAHKAATGRNNLPEPTPAQKLAGNYLMGRFRLHGLDVRIENPEGTFREGTDADGQPWRTRLAAHYGYFAGTRGADGDPVDVFIGVLPESPHVWVINQVEPSTGAFDEHKVMLGFGTEDLARAGYLGSYTPGWQGLGSMVRITLAQLRWWLKSGDRTAPIRSAADLLSAPEPKKESSMKPVQWDNATSQPLGQTLGKVLYDIRLDDAGDDLMTDPMTMDDLLSDPDIDSLLVFDALVVEAGMLKTKTDQILTVLKAAGKTVQPQQVEIGEPVRLKGTMQIPVIYGMSDGQTLAIWFHNPDTTPAKLAPMDVLVSARWVINKKDVTIVVAPEKGKDLSPRDVARRIMALIEKNSAAFQRVNAKAGERAAAIEGLQTEIAGLEQQLDGLKVRVERAQEVRASAAAKAPKVAQADRPAPAPAAATSVLPVDGSEFLAAGYQWVDRAKRFSKQFDLEAPMYVVASVAKSPNGWKVTMDLQTGQPAPHMPMNGGEFDTPAAAISGVDALVAELADEGGTVPAAAPEPAPEPTPAPDWKHINPADLPGVAGKMMSADQYAMVYGNQEAEAYWQDVLDNQFNQRVIDTRNAARELGWDAPTWKWPMTNSTGVKLNADFRPSPGGGNIVGITYQISIGGEGVAAIRDDLSKSPDELAAEINALAPVKAAEPAAAEPVPAPQIPPAIKTRVEMLIDRLRAKKDVLAGVERARGNGHTLSLEWDRWKPDVMEKLGRIERLRETAANKGLGERMDEMIAAYGGVPDFSMYRTTDEVRSAEDAAPAASEAGEAPAQAPITVSNRERVRDENGFFMTRLTLSDGSVHDLQKMDSTGSMGLPGWHVVSDKATGVGWAAVQPTYMGDNEAMAVESLLSRENRRAGSVAPTAAAAPAPATAEAANPPAVDKFSGPRRKFTVARKWNYAIKETTPDAYFHTDQATGETKAYLGGKLLGVLAAEKKSQSNSAISYTRQDGYIYDTPVEDPVGAAAAGPRALEPGFMEIDVDATLPLVEAAGVKPATIQALSTNKLSNERGTKVNLKRIAHEMGVTPIYVGQAAATTGADPVVEPVSTEPPTADLFGDAQPEALIPEGTESKAKTAKGTEVLTGYSVIEADRLITSHDPSTGDANPAFPAELQPRDRGRDASIAWVRKTANDLDPDLLGKSRRADSGAPIIGPDGVVESGNGRTMAVVLAYQIAKAGDYRAWLEDEATYFGLKPEKVKAMRRPVLVRIRTSQVDRAAFAIEANQSDTLAMTATEKAKSDARRMDDGMIALMTENGDLAAAENVPFLSAFLRTLGEAEAAQYSTSDGKPTSTLIARVQAAIFAKAYADDRLLELTADVAKPEIANIVKALNHAAPEFIQAAAMDPDATSAATGKLTDAVEKSLNQKAVDALLGASNVIRQAKDAGQSVEEFVQQSGLFGDIDPDVAAMAVFIAKNNRSAKRMGEAFKAMATFIKGEIQRRQTGDMFGDSEPVAFADIVAAANRELERMYGPGVETIGLFDRPAAEVPASEPTPAAEPAAAPAAEAPAPDAPPAEPEVDPVAAVNAAYTFDKATDDFKALLAESLDQTDYSEFVTAKAIDQAVKAAGGTVSWSLVVGAILDSVAEISDGWEMDEPSEYEGIFDSVGDGEPQGVIRKGSRVLGRAVVAGDGKAMIYIGAKGNRRVRFASGAEAMWSDDDAAEMVRALFVMAGENVVVPTKYDPLENVHPDELNKRIARFKENINSLQMDLDDPSKISAYGSNEKAIAKQKKLVRDHEKAIAAWHARQELYKKRSEFEAAISTPPVSEATPTEPKVRKVNKKEAAEAADRLEYQVNNGLSGQTPRELVNGSAINRRRIGEAVSAVEALKTGWPAGVTYPQGAIDSAARWLERIAEAEAEGDDLIIGAGDAKTMAMSAGVPEDQWPAILANPASTRTSGSIVVPSYRMGAIKEAIGRAKAGPAVPVEPAAAPVDAPRSADAAFLRSVIDKTAPGLLDPATADKIEAIMGRHPDDAEIDALAGQAIDAFTAAAMEATAGLK